MKRYNVLMKMGDKTFYAFAVPVYKYEAVNFMIDYTGRAEKWLVSP